MKKIEILQWIATAFNNQKKGTRTMRATFIRRRVAVAVVAGIVLYPAVTAVWGLVNRPTFTCVEGQFTLTQGDTLSGRVPDYCDGLMADAISWVIKTNQIQDVGNLQPGMVITVKEKK